MIFVARAFTQYQQAASGFKDLPIELWKVTRYDGDLVLYDPIESKNNSVSVRTLRPGKNTEEVVEQVKTYREDDVLPPAGKVRELYDELKERVMKLDPQLIVHARKNSVAFRVPDNWRNIFAVHFRASKLRIELMRTKAGDLNDPERKVAYIEDSPKHWKSAHIPVRDWKPSRSRLCGLPASAGNRTIQEDAGLSEGIVVLVIPYQFHEVDREGLLRPSGSKLRSLHRIGRSSAATCPSCTLTG